MCVCAAQAAAATAAPHHLLCRCRWDSSKHSTPRQSVVTATDAGDTSSERAKWQLLVTHIRVARLLRSVCFPVPPDEWLVRVAASWVVCGSASKCTSP